MARQQEAAANVALLRTRRISHLEQIWLGVCGWAVVVQPWPTDWSAQPVLVTNDYGEVATRVLVPIAGRVL